MAYGARVSKDTISKITDKVIEELNEWVNRPMDRVYPVVFIDAIVVKVRDGQVTTRPFYGAVSVTTSGKRDILGIWTDDSSEGAKYWNQFIPFLDYDLEIRRVICSTNAIESTNARYRRAVRARDHFPNEQATLKCLYLVTRSPDPTGRDRAR